ncbi:MAG: hypothetical protein LIP16_20610 [Clostridium sp.]|nr:hypothetical protein [Clostridium sp.]
MAKKGSKGVTIWFDLDVYNWLKAEQARTGDSINDMVRTWTKQGMNGTLCEENLSIISKILREQLTAILKPYEERSLSMQAKNSIQSGTVLYLLMNAMEELSNLEKDDIEFMYELARKKSVSFLKSKGE